MGMFDYRGEDGRELVRDSLDLVNYAYHGLFAGERERYEADGYISTSFLEGAYSVLWVGDGEVRNEDAIADVTAAGWTVLTASDLGLSEDRTNEYDTFSGITDQFKNAQADVLAKYDENGNLVQIGFAIRGTTGPIEELAEDTIGDVLDFLEFLTKNPNYTQEAFSDVLEAIRDLAVANGLDGSDVLVTGHSLGGGATTNLAETADQFLDGFYVDANYIALAAHYVAEDGVSVLDNGAEVFSYNLENDPVPSVIDGQIPYILGTSREYEFSTDNIVLFNDLYNGPIFAAGAPLVNVLAWSAHLDHAYYHSFERIIESEFYDEMTRDSLIIVADLSDATRDYTWVGDIDLAFFDTGHHGDSAYILGGKYDDLLRGNDEGDSIEGFGGDDYLKGEGGDDRLLGGDGDDRIKGGSGDDRIWDGAGADELEGNWGEDVFIMARDGDTDRIEDFNEGKDLIDLSEWGVTSTSDIVIQNTSFWSVRVRYEDEILDVVSDSVFSWLTLESNDFIFA